MERPLIPEGAVYEGYAVEWALRRRAADADAPREARANAAILADFVAVQDLDMEWVARDAPPWALDAMLSCVRDYADAVAASDDAHLRENHPIALAGLECIERRRSRSGAPATLARRNDGGRNDAPRTLP